MRRHRRHRRQAEYPDVSTPELVADDIVDDLPKVTAIVDIAERVLEQMSVY